MRNRYLNQDKVKNVRHLMLKKSDLKKNRTVDINILLNRIKVDKSKTYFNNLKKYFVLISIVCITALFTII